MNIALPTAVIVLGLLPGIIFSRMYFTARFPRQVFGASPVSEFAQYVVFALPTNSAALLLYHRLVGDVPLSWEATFQIIVGTASDDTVASFSAQLGDNYLSLVVCYSFFLLTALFLGTASRRFVWAFRLDLFLRPLRMKSDWYYTLQGRVRDFPRNVLSYADVLTAHPDGSRLYRGLVVAFTSTATGEIQELVLKRTERYRHSEDTGDWIEIPGNNFVLFGSAIHSINLRYFAVERERAQSWWVRRWRSALAFLRSLAFEEP